MPAAALLALLAALPLPARAEADSIPVQRHLESLKLGDRPEDVRVIYPPVREWEKSRELSGGVERIIIQKGQAKYLPETVESMTLRFRRHRLVHLEVVYGRDFSKKKPLERVVVDLSLQYGEPRRQGESYFWWDSATALVASTTPQPDPSGKGEVLRTTLAVMDRARFDPLR